MGGREGESLWALKRGQGDQASGPTRPLGVTLSPSGAMGSRVQWRA